MSKQIVKGIDKYVSVFREAKEKDMNEADIVTRVVKFSEEVLGYDVFKEITKEFQIKDRYVDLAIKIDDKIKFYIEVKSANVKLKESQIYQAESYASQSGIPLVVLTNGAEWQLYHLVFDKTGIDHSMVFSIDLINGNTEENADKLYYLSCGAMRKDEIEDFWHKQVSLNPDSIIKALFHEDTLTAIRREIRRISDVLVDEDEIVDSIKRLLSSEVLSQFGEAIKIRRKRRTRKAKSDSDNREPDEFNKPILEETDKTEEKNQTIKEEPNEKK